MHTRSEFEIFDLLDKLCNQVDQDCPFLVCVHSLGMACIYIWFMVFVAIIYLSVQRESSILTIH